MELIHIQIGEVKTLEVENWQLIPDDRQERIEIIGGIVIQDFGHVPAGDKITCNVTVFSAGWNLIKKYWSDREKVDVTDEAGNIWKDMRVVVKGYSYKPNFPKVYQLQMELWRE